MDQLSKLLLESGYDQEALKFLVQGFSEGFNLQYKGNVNRRDMSCNLPLHCGSDLDLWEKVMKEVKLGRYAGPYESIPYNNFIQSPIGLVPKAGNQTRLIFHLSYRFKVSGNESVNDCTPKELCKVKYNDLDHAVSNALKLLRKVEKMAGTTGVLWFGKTDIKSAFRILPGSPKCWWILILKVTHPRMKVMYYFVDKCLPFRHSISCALFQKFSDALAHMCKYLIGKLALSDPLTNYLDNFLFIALSQFCCNEMLRTFLTMCLDIGVPVALEKTEWGNTYVIFLGILLEGQLHVLAVTEEKQQKALNSLFMLQDKKKATVKELESLAGLLNFLNKAIFPGRAFTRRMYAQFSGNGLKQHHHVLLNAEFKMDCHVWTQFLTSGNMAICHPFVDLSSKILAEDLGFFTDAAKGKNLGIGGIFQRNWYFAKWEPGYIEQCDPSIEYLKLFGVCMGVFIWCEELRNQQILIHCDNQSVVAMLNSTSSKCKNCMFLLMELTLLSLKLNFRIFASWVKGLLNEESDMLSHQKIQQFKAVAGA